MPLSKPWSQQRHEPVLIDSPHPNSVRWPRTRPVLARGDARPPVPVSGLGIQNRRFWLHTEDRDALRAPRMSTEAPKGTQRPKAGELTILTGVKLKS